MSRTSLMLAALLVLPACDSADGPASPADPAGNGGAQAGNAPAPSSQNKGEPAQTEKKTDPWQAALDKRVLASSGLAEGGKLSAFDIFNCDTGERYCQVCSYGPNPKLMAVGTADDAEFHEDLKDLDAIVKKYGDDKLKAFAVITELEDGKARIPKDPQALQAKAKELKAKLRIDIPVVVPAPLENGENPVWEDYYNITQSRTVMFADGHNDVKYNGVAPEDFSKLNDAIIKVIES